MPARTPSEIHALFLAAFNQGDLEGLVALYEPDATLVISGRAIVGHDAIREAYQQLLQGRGQMELETRSAIESRRRTGCAARGLDTPHLRINRARDQHRSSSPPARRHVAVHHRRSPHAPSSPASKPFASMSGLTSESSGVGIPSCFPGGENCAADSSLVGPWRRCVYCCDRCCVRDVQCGCVVAAAYARSHVEQRVVSAVRVRGDQLHQKLGVCLLRGPGIMDWSLCLDDLAPTAAKRFRRA